MQMDFKFLGFLLGGKASKDVAHVPSQSFEAKSLVATMAKAMSPVVAAPVVAEEERDPDRLFRIFVAVPDGKAAVTFYEEAFGFHEVRRIKNRPSSPFPKMVKNFVAEIDFGGYVFVIHEAPYTLHPDGFRDYLILATPRPDVYMARAVSAGAVAEGDLVRGKLGMVGRVKDPIGFVWQISEHMLEPMLPGPFRSNKN